MPKTAMDENGSPELSQDDIGLSRHASLVNTEAKALPVQCFSKRDLGLRVFRTDSRHSLGSLRRCQVVDHALM